MAIEPDISLNTWQPNPQQSPMAMMQQGLGVAQGMQQLYLTRQSIQARQKAGQLIATAPDTQTAIKAMMADPSIAAFAPEMMQNMASLGQTLQATQGMQQGQSESAIESFLKLAPGAANDPSKLSGLMESELAAMPEGPAKQTAQAGMKSLVAGLTANYKPGDSKSLAAYQQQLAGVLTSFGTTAQVIQDQAGHPQTIANVGGVAVNLSGQGSGGVNGLSPDGQQGPGPGPINAPQPGQPDGPPVGQGPGLAQQAAIPAEQKQIVDMNQDYNDEARVLGPQMNRLRAVGALLKGFQAGQGANAKDEMGRALQAAKNLGLPIPDDLINKVDSGSIGDFQAFKNEIQGIAIQGITSANVAGGKFATANELNNAINSLTPDMDPRALLKVLGQVDQNLRQRADAVEDWHDFNQKVQANDPSVQGYRIQDFPQWQLQQQTKNPTAHRTPSLLPDIEEVKGAQPQKAEAQTAAIGDAKKQLAIAQQKGYDPAKAIQMIIQRAKEHGVDLKPEDLQ